MKNRVTVTIAGQEYTLVAAEDVRYVQRVASHVDAKVQEVLDGAKVSMVDGAVLAAVNIAGDRREPAPSAQGVPGGGHQDEAGALRGQTRDF